MGQNGPRTTVIDVDIPDHHSSTADISIRALLVVPSLTVKINAAVMITTYRLYCVGEWKNSFNHWELNGHCPVEL